MAVPLVAGLVVVADGLDSPVTQKFELIGLGDFVVIAIKPQS